MSLLEVFQGIMMIAAMSFKWIHYMKLVYSVVMSAIKFFYLREPLPPSLVLGFGRWNKIGSGNNIDCFLALQVPLEKNMDKKWNVMRQSLNQKCLDIKNKKRPKAEEKLNWQQWNPSNSNSDNTNCKFCFSWISTCSSVIFTLLT